MQRYNIFNQLHKGLEALLYDTAIMIQQTAFCQPVEGNIILEKLDNLLYLFSQHALLEDTHLLPVLRRIEKTAVAPVFQVLFALAENELSAIRWQKIQEGLIEGAMVA